MALQGTNRQLGAPAAGARCSGTPPPTPRASPLARV